MTKFTKERLTQIVRAIDSEAYDEAEIMVWFNSDDIMAMARQLLAGLEQEPVAYIDPFTFKNFATYRAGEADNKRMGREWVWANPDAGLIPLYEAPQLPQPAVAITQHFDTISLDTAKMVMCDVNRRDEFLGGDIQLLSRIQCRIDEACRAAMLQGAEPVSQPYTLREGVAAIRNSGIAIDAEKIQAERDALNEPTCWCLTCRPVTMTDMRFVVCPDCGNKRCPHANDHRNACTGSNEPGQEGSAYPAAPQQEVKP